jgi:hypothetical protein
MPDYPASRQSGTGMKKLTMPDLFRYRNKETHSGILLVWYWTEMTDADAGVSFLDADAHLCIFIFLLKYFFHTVFFGPQKVEAGFSNQIPTPIHKIFLF